MCDWAVVPSRNPFRNLLWTTLRCLIRPVPVVLRLLALMDQPYPRVLAPGYPHWAQVFFWMWRLTRPQRRHKVWVLFRRLPNELVPLVCKISKKKLLFSFTEKKKSNIVLQIKLTAYLVYIFTKEKRRIILLWIELSVSLMFVKNTSSSLKIKICETFFWTSPEMSK